ncbi:hypothetical protein L596_030838 [Steinernema carpocapsae]|uniref:Uncharacterized protein n=1 Tax=Steinernema carpocapsae TaxID=34508 RepID=A0A4V5ZWS5_STECR|nr:hypothetical protein L596_030838 [Steinernema carpocapsae]
MPRLQIPYLNFCKNVSAIVTFLAVVFSETNAHFVIVLILNLNCACHYALSFLSCFRTIITVLHKFSYS